MNRQEQIEFAERHITEALEVYTSITREELLYEMQIRCAIIYPPIKIAASIMGMRMDMNMKDEVYTLGVTTKAK
jgi:hypothetical protein